MDAGFHSARYELEDCENEAKLVVELLNRGSNSTYEELKEYSNILTARISTFEFAMRSTTSKYSKHKVEIDQNKEITKATLVDLHARVIAAQLKASASERRWKSLVYRVKYTVVSKVRGGYIGIECRVIDTFY